MPDFTTVNAEIIAIGTEILLGEITDTNSGFIARALRDIGVNVYYFSAVGDNEKRIADVIRASMSRSNLVVTCGGLGPTVDDMTRQAVALATSRNLVFHQSLLDQIAARFASFRATMTDNNRRQAFLPENALLIENPVGTAPSFMVEHNGSMVISLPGVPREMKFLLAEKVLPLLKERFKLGEGIIKARVLKTAGIGESMLDARIGDDLLNASNPSIGLAAHTGQVDVRITARASDEAQADLMIAGMETQLRERIGQFVFGVNNERLEDVLIALLKQQAWKLAIVEAGINGAVSRRLRESAFFEPHILDQVSEYPNPAALNTQPGLELRLIAESAAQSANQDGVASIAIVSQPDVAGDQADRTPATAVAVCVDGQVQSREYGFGSQAEVASAWVSSWSLAMIWRALQDKLAAT
jgi:nicotinamide-nucleotide amidase